MATHSSIPAWRIPWTEEPGGLQSTGLQSQTRLSEFTSGGGCPPGLKRTRLAGREEISDLDS